MPGWKDACQNRLLDGRITNRSRFVPVAEALSRVVPDSNRRMILSIRHEQVKESRDSGIKLEQATESITGANGLHFVGTSFEGNRRRLPLPWWFRSE